MKLDISKTLKSIKYDRPEILFAALQTILQAFPDMIFVKDMSLTYVAGSPSFAAMVGKDSMEEILGRTDDEIFEDKELAKRYTADDRKLLARGGNLVNYVEPLTDQNGEPRYSSTSKYILTDPAGQPIGLLGISEDITKEVLAYRQHRQEVEYLFTLPEDTYAAILVDISAWRIVGQRRKPGSISIPHFETMEEFLSVMPGGIRGRHSEAKAFYRQFSQEYLQDIYSQGKSTLSLEYQRRLSDGHTYWIRDEMKFMLEPRVGHLHLMILVQDIHSKKQAVESLVQAAVTDQMTGLLNRAAVQQEIEAFLQGPGADGTHAIFMIDADDFKTVNDTYGHREGDALLVQLAHGIQNCFRETDIVGRIGGDEFFVLAKNMGNRDSLKTRAEHLLRVIREIRATRTAALTSISVGISIYPQDGKTLNELYAKADEALYKAKGQGKNQAAFASEEQTLWSSTASAMRYEAYNSRIADHSNSICYISDLETYELLHLTKAGMALYGLQSPEEYLGKKCYKVIMGLDAPCPFCPNGKLKEGQEYRWEHYNPNLRRWFDRSSYIIQLDGRPRHLEIGRDITARKEEISLLSGNLTMEDVLFHCLHTLTKERDMDMAVNLFLEAVGGYYQANRAYIVEFDFTCGLMDNTFEWCRTGVSASIELLQRLPIEICDSWIKKFETTGEFSISALDSDLSPESEDYQILKAQDIDSLMAAPLLQNGRIVGFIGVDDPRQKQGNLVLLRSVSEFVQAELERRRLMAELEHMSFTDSLTGLNNRNQYDRVLKEYSHRTPESLGIISLDINGLRSINDSHGHSFGDHVIKKTGQIMQETLSGKVFRTGGDEFMALCENISREAFRQEVIALRSAFAKDQDCYVSIGSTWRENEENIQALLLQAGELLAAEKQVYYHTVLQEGRETVYSGLAKELGREIEAGRFIVYYQPQVDIQTGRIIGAEALVRKKADNGSLIPPNKFIPFYEAEGIIRHVDLYVLDTACATLRQWLNQGHQLRLSVNFSRMTLLEADIVESISKICQKHSISPSSLTIEVTESVSKMDPVQLQGLIQTVKAAGFSISLDDFGSQYSNLSILADMAFDEVKFDKSLVSALEHNRKSQIVMENSIKLCHDLDDIYSLAEGIETKGQLDLLMNYRCDRGQGYYFSKPLPSEEFQALLEKS